METADFVFAWLVVVTAICFGARLLFGAGEQRFARGVYDPGRQLRSVAVTPRRRAPDRKPYSVALVRIRAGYRPRAYR
jgi:hypothetical protein